MKNVHTYPLEDTFPHNTDSEYCWCDPKVENYGSIETGIVLHIIHNSFDGREFYEETPKYVRVENYGDFLLRYE